MRILINVHGVNKYATKRSATNLWMGVIPLFLFWYVSVAPMQISFIRVSNLRSTFKVLPVKKRLKNCCKEMFCSLHFLQSSCTQWTYPSKHVQTECILLCRKCVLSIAKCIQTFTIFTISIRQWNFWVEPSMCFYVSILCVFLNFPKFFFRTQPQTYRCTRMRVLFSLLSTISA